MGDMDLYIFNTKIYQEVNLPAHVADNYLNELSSLGFIEEKVPRASGGSIRLYHLTKEVLKNAAKTLTRARGNSPTIVTAILF
jgi:hypothetical protein